MTFKDRMRYQVKKVEDYLQGQKKELGMSVICARYDCDKFVGADYIFKRGRFFCSLDCLAEWAVLNLPHFLAKQVIEETQNERMPKLREENAQGNN